MLATRASASVSGGSSPGIVRASIVLPEPGGPVSSNPWPPARAISSARRPTAWPRTSARSGASGPGPDRLGRRSLAWPCSPAPPADRHWSVHRRPARSARVASAGSACGAIRPAAGARRPGPDSTPVAASTSGARLASPAASDGTTIRRDPRSASATTIGNVPGTARRSPPSDSSPMNAHRPVARTWSEPSRMPMAMARSSEAPALRRSAGARLTVIRRGGNARPLLRIAPRTRSRASWSAASGRPTIVNPGRPGATSTSTRMTRPSMPWSVAA